MKLLEVEVIEEAELVRELVKVEVETPDCENKSAAIITTTISITNPEFDK